MGSSGVAAVGGQRPVRRQPIRQQPMNLTGPQRLLKESHDAKTGHALVGGHVGAGRQDDDCAGGFGRIGQLPDSPDQCRAVKTGHIDVDHYAIEMSARQDRKGVLRRAGDHVMAFGAQPIDGGFPTDQLIIDHQKRETPAQVVFRFGELGQGQSELKPATGSGGRIGHGQLPSHSLNQITGNGQPQPDARRRPRRSIVTELETGKEPLALIRRNTAPGIGNRKAGGP